MKRLGGFVYNLDRALQPLIFGGPPQETISSQIGRGAVAGKWWGKAGRVLLNATLGKNHCENAIKHADALDRADDGKEQ